MPSAATELELEAGALQLAKDRSESPPQPVRLANPVQPAAPHAQPTGSTRPASVTPAIPAPKEPTSETRPASAQRPANRPDWGIY
jgi:hypothetical protein